MSELETNKIEINNKLLGNEFSLKTEEGKQLYLKLNSLADQFIIRDDQENKIKIEKKALILEMADIYEQMHEKGEYLLPVTSICSSIYKFVARKGYDISQSFVYKTIKDNAPQYLNERIDDLTKDLYKKDSNWYQNFHSKNIDTQIKNKQYKEAIELILSTSPSDIDNSIIQEYTPKLDQHVGGLYDYSRKNNINTISFNENEPFFDSKDVDPFKEIIRTHKPEYRENDLGEQLINLGDSHIELGNVLKSAGKKAYQFPFEENDPRESKFAKIIEQASAFNRLLVKAVKPMTDLKYKRSLLQWFDIEKTERDHGVHAASSKNPGSGLIKDPDTGEWIRVKRNLTREHIDDKVPEIRKLKTLFKKWLYPYLLLNEWYIACMEDYSIGQAHRLSAKLSDRKFK